MNMKITETTREERAAFGARLQSARESKSLSRPQVAELTNIPVKSLEKFENGTMSPNVERLQALASVLEVSLAHLLDGEPIQVIAEPDTAPVAHSVPEPEFEHSIIDDLLAEMEALDEMREEGFQKYWRTAPRQFSVVATMIDTLDLDELLDVAERRGLMAIPQSEIEALPTLEAEAQGEFVADIEARIFDTAYFDIDLNKIDPDQLCKLAEKLDVPCDKQGVLSMWTEWSSEAKMIKALRPVLQERALKGTAPKLTDENDFPMRKIA